MCTRTQYYLESTNNYRPVNIVPSALVKCKTCNIHFDTQEMQLHLLTHISPQFLNKGGMLKTGHLMKRVAIREMLNQQGYENGNQGIDVKSVLPDSMGAVDKQNASPPVLSSNGNVHQDSIRASRHLRRVSSPIFTQDSLDVASRFSEQYVEKEGNNQMLTFGKPVLMEFKKVAVQRKNINLYQNIRKDEEGHFDNRVHQKKQQPNLQESVKENYNIVKLETKKKVKNEPIKIQLKNHRRTPSYKSKISTVSGSNAFKQARLSSFFGDQAQAQSQTATNNGQNEQNHQLECNNCHGFYCKVCKSDIPPMFRPVPNKQNSRISFQDLHNYHNSRVHSVRKTSRVTKCTNCE